MFYWNEDILLAEHEEEIANEKQMQVWEASCAEDAYEEWLRSQGVKDVHD